VTDVTTLNVQGASEIKKSIEGARKTIEEQKARIEMFEARMHALAIVEEQQLAVELS